jgi:hypothetical protein
MKTSTSAKSPPWSTALQEISAAWLRIARLWGMFRILALTHHWPSPMCSEVTDTRLRPFSAEWPLDATTKGL